MRPTMKMMDVTRQVWFNWSSSAAKTVCNSSIQCTSAVALHHPVLRHPLYQSTMLYHVLSFQCTESWGQDNILVFWHKGTISMCSWAIFLLIEALYVVLNGRNLARSVQGVVRPTMTQQDARFVWTNRAMPPALMDVGYRNSIISWSVEVQMMRICASHNTLQCKVYTQLVAHNAMTHILCRNAHTASVGEGHKFWDDIG